MSFIAKFILVCYFFTTFVVDMKMLRLVIFLFLCVLSSTGFEMVATSAPCATVEHGTLRDASDDKRGVEDREVEKPQALLQEALPLGQLSLRPQRTVAGHSNVLSRGGNRYLSAIKYKHIYNKSQSCELREESSPISVVVSSDYYVIALRHIIR